jgi:hypothetical protein
MSIAQTIKEQVAKIVAKGRPAGVSDSDEYFYEQDAEEFDLVELLLEQYVLNSKLEAGSTPDSELFEKYVREQHPDLAAVLKCDPGLYAAVIVDYNGLNK